ncbi:MAG: hypothetical protein WDW38_004350 [Sanguina aurantia]
MQGSRCAPQAGELLQLLHSDPGHALNGAQPPRGRSGDRRRVSRSQLYKALHHHNFLADFDASPACQQATHAAGLLALGARKAAPLPSSALSPKAGSCLATSNFWAELVQSVDLLSELHRRGLGVGLATHLLDSGLVLGISLWVGTRCDKRGVFQLALLMDEGGSEQASPQSFVPRPCRHHFFSGKLATPEGSWARFAYSAVLPRGCRRVMVVLRGREVAGTDTGRSDGPRFCSPEMSFLPSEAGFGAAESRACWKLFQPDPSSPLLPLMV